MNKPRPKLKPLSQRPKPTKPIYAPHWCDEQGNIIPIPNDGYCSSRSIGKLKSMCKQYGIEVESYGKLVKRVKGDRREKDTFLSVLEEERSRRRKAIKELEAYYIRLKEWRAMKETDAAA
jgi:hypothetical protein